MTKYKLTVLMLLHFNTKKFLLLFILYQKFWAFFVFNNLLFKIFRILVLKFKQQIYYYKITNNSLSLKKLLKFNKLGILKKKINRLYMGKQYNLSYFFKSPSYKNFIKKDYFSSSFLREILNFIVSVGFSGQNIIFLTEPYLSLESYLLNLHCMGIVEASRLSAKLKYFLFLNKHDKLSKLANYCFILNPSEVNYKNMSYYRNRYVPIMGVSTTKNLNAIYDKTIFISEMSESKVYALASLVLINYISGRNLTMYYNSQVYYTQVI